MPRHQVAEACETEHSKGGPMRFSSGSLGWKWEVHGTKTSEEVIFPHVPPLYNKCILFQRKSRKSIKFIFCYAALNRMSLWILLKSMRVLSFYLTLGLPFLGPRVHSNPPPSRTLQPKSPLSAGKGSLLWIGTKAKELGCKLKWPRTPKVRLQKIKCATVIPANPKHSTKRSTSTC